MVHLFNRKTAAIIFGGGSVIYNEILTWSLIIKLSNVSNLFDYYTDHNSFIMFFLLFFFLELPVCWIVLRILKNRPNTRILFETRIASLLCILIYFSVYAFSREIDELIVFCVLSLSVCWASYAFWIHILGRIMYKQHTLTFN